MINTLNISFRLKNTYKKNKTLYGLKNIPLIKKLIPENVYSKKSFKTIGLIIGSIFSFIWAFLSKFFIIMFLLICCIPESKVMFSNLQELSPVFLHCMFWGLLSISVFSSNLFIKDYDKYYAIILLKMDAKKYVLSNYIFSSIISFISWGIVIRFFGKVYGCSLMICILLAVFIISCRSLFNGIVLYFYNQNKYFKTRFLIIIFSAIIMYYGAHFNFIVPIIVYKIIWFITFIFGLYSLNFLFRFNNYQKVYKNILTTDFLEKELTSILPSSKKTNINFELSKNTYKNKGIPQLNYLFFNRYKGIISRKLTINYLLSIFSFISILIIILAQPLLKNYFDKILRFMYCMGFYASSLGLYFGKIMYKYCDNSMISFKAYRNQEIIYQNYKERMKYLIKMDSMQILLNAILTFLVCFILPLNMSLLDYILIIITTILLILVFDIHNLLKYFLFEPYLISPAFHSIIYKNSVQGMLDTLIYFLVASFLIIIPFSIFEYLVIGIGIIYIPLSFVLVKKYAAKN